MTRPYSFRLTAEVNSKGVLDVDVVKGCTAGISSMQGGCYGHCYAAAIAKFRGIDFSRSVVRKVLGNAHAKDIERTVKAAPLGFFRVGTMGDPCHAWEDTCEVVEWLSQFATPVIVTKHWMRATDDQLRRLIQCGAVLNTSVSALDSPAQLTHRERQLMRYADLGGESIARIVSCEFNEADPLGAKLAATQRRLFSRKPVIDNPLRAPRTHPLVQAGVIRLRIVRDLNAKRTVSINDEAAYVGHCDSCPDQCGLSSTGPAHVKPVSRQSDLFKQARDYLNG
jgi:hypothetical protein